MGGGTYSFQSRSLRSVKNGYQTKSNEEIFSGSMSKSMDPKTALLRESRDSDEHPNSYPIIIALDVTASMGSVPRMLIQTGLPNLMKLIIDSGVPDPQLLFLAVGDHKSDQHPLQVGQFESNDLALDNWLTSTYIENGGGGNGGESYMLPWYFAAMHTVTDSVIKRNKKGLLITIGDEPCHSFLHKNAINSIMGEGEVGYESKDLLIAAQKTYEVKHIHLDRGYDSERVKNSWIELIGENLISTSDHNEIPKIIADAVKKGFDYGSDISDIKNSDIVKDVKVDMNSEVSEEVPTISDAPDML